MIERYRQVIRLINKNMKKYLVFGYAKKVIGSTTEKVQNKFSNAQNIAAQKYNIVAKVRIKYIISRQKSLFINLHFFYIDKYILNI